MMWSYLYHSLSEANTGLMEAASFANILQM